MKKILSFLLSMLLILTALSGCAATSNNGIGSGESGTDESDTLEIGSSELNSSESVADIPSESEKDNDKKLTENMLFTFEPHIRMIGKKYGFKFENIYYFENGSVREL